MKRTILYLTVVFLSLSVYCQTNTPVIKISASPDDIKNGTGFIVPVEGKVTGAVDLYTYLVVEDNGVKWIQPTAGFGKGIDGKFEGNCYLGQKTDSDFPKTYIVYAIVTTTPYNAYENLNSKTIKSTSNKITLIRRR